MVKNELVPYYIQEIKCSICQRTFFIKMTDGRATRSQRQYGSLLETNPISEGAYCFNCYAWPHKFDYMLWDSWKNPDPRQPEENEWGKMLFESLISRKLIEYNLINSWQILKILISILPTKSELDLLRKKFNNFSMIKSEIQKNNCVCARSINDELFPALSKFEALKGYKMRGKFLESLKPLKRKLEINLYKPYKYNNYKFNEWDYNSLYLLPILTRWIYKKRRKTEKILCLDDKSIRAIFLLNPKELRMNLDNLSVILR